MANQEYKTTVISYDARLHQDESKPKDDIKSNIHNVLFNITTKVPHVAETLPTMKIETEETEENKKVDLRPIQKINKNSAAFPTFYLREYKRSGKLVILWMIITAICLALETWALVAIIKDSSVSNWLALLLIPALTFCIAFLVIYANNWVNFRNEARCVDFTQGKIPTISVMKLYKRLKTAHINVNWFCGLTYILGGLTILIVYLVGWGCTGFKIWGSLKPSLFPKHGGPALLITMIIASTALVSSFIMHIVLLVTNYTRAAKIDSYYSVQIVSDEELTALKKKKNKRDLIIFLAVIAILVLIGMFIYKTVKSKKVNNTVTINNGPSIKAI